MEIFISHSHTERQLADAIKAFIESLAPGINVWYSSDPDPTGGIGIGRWREKIGKKLEESDIVLAIFTPETESKPWIFFECAYAMGLNKNKEVIPIVFYMSKHDLPSPLQNHQVYEGENKENIKELFLRLIHKYAGKFASEQFLILGLEAYEKKIKIHNQKWLSRSLFHGKFHNYNTAKFIEGKWFSKWTEISEMGKESLFNMSTLEIWTTNKRLRIVGKGKNRIPYPMEGVISSKGYIALSYWSKGEIPICGTALLELIGGNRIMEGTWEGYTTISLLDRLEYVRGRVVIGREKSAIDRYRNIKI